MHWLTGQLCEDSRETMYRQSIKTRIRLETSVSLIVSSLIFGMFAIADYYLLGLSRDYYLLLTMRIVVVSLCLLLAVIIWRWGSYSRRVWLHALPLWIIGHRHNSDCSFAPREPLYPGHRGGSGDHGILSPDP